MGLTGLRYQSVMHVRAGVDRGALDVGYGVPTELPAGLTDRIRERSIPGPATGPKKGLQLTSPIRPQFLSVHRNRVLSSSQMSEPNRAKVCF